MAAGENLVRILGEQADRFPDKPLYVFHDRGGSQPDTVTRREFERQTNHLAQYLAEIAGIGPGKPVLLSFNPGLAMIRNFFACVKLGAIPVPVAPVSASGGTTGFERLVRIAADSGSRTVLFDFEQNSIVRQILEVRKPEDDDGSLEAVAGLDWVDTGSTVGGLDHFAARPQDPLFLQYTSGSTSTPRGVVVRHRNVIENSARPSEEDCVTLSWLPHYHDMGLIGYYLFPLIVGGTGHHFSALNFLRRPVLWLELISSLKATRTSAPNFAFDYCASETRIPPEQLEGIDLSSLVDIMNASEPVRPETLQAFKSRFSRYGLRDSALTVAYGLAENTLRVTDGGRVPLPVNRERLARGVVETARGSTASSQIVTIPSCGSPVHGVDIAIVDPETHQALPAGRTGEIWITGTGKAEGYWRRPELSRDMFHAQIAGRPGCDGYLRSGDIGFVTEGELYVCGRIRDMVIIRGRNVFPNDVERAILSRFAEVSPGRVAVFGSGSGEVGEESLGILVEAERAGERLPIEEIGRHVRQAFQLEVTRVTQIRRGTIPKTSSGKIVRYLCRARLEKEEFEIIADHRPLRLEEPDGPADAYLDQLLSRAGAGASDETTISDLGLDSLDLVQLATVIETEATKSGFEAQDNESVVNDLRLLQSVTVGSIRSLLGRLAEGTIDRTELAGFLEAAMKGIEEREADQMRRDSRMCAGLSFPQGSPKPDEGVTLLIGGTGFIGSFVAESLLRLDDKPIRVLVRAESRDHGRNRVRDALARTGLLSAETIGLALGSRIEVVCGDLGEERLGLPPGDWNELASDVSEVMHCGAHIDYVRPYSELRTANVVGTAEIIRLCQQRRPKILNYISTTFVHGWSPHLDKDESERNTAMNGLDFGYSQSKWVAEQLVHSAAEGGLTTRIFRPALITASQTGAYARGDIVARLLGYCIRHGVAPDARNQLSLLPVEICANNIVAISRDPESVGATFNVTANRIYTIGTVANIISEKFGYAIGMITLEEFIDHIEINCDRMDELFPLKQFFKKNRQNFRSIENQRYKNPNYARFCSELPDTMPEPELDITVGWILNFLQNNRLVPPPKPNGANPDLSIVANL